jgi:hypothetical protein
MELELKLLKNRRRCLNLRPRQLLLDLPPKDRVGSKIWPDLDHMNWSLAQPYVYPCHRDPLP